MLGLTEAERVERKRRCLSLGFQTKFSLVAAWNATSNSRDAKFPLWVTRPISVIISGEISCL